MGHEGDPLTAPPGTQGANARSTRVPLDDELVDFFENGSLALHIVDGNGIIVRANRAEMDLLGYAPEEYIGQPIARFHADQAVIEDILARLQRGETIRNYPARLIARDGSTREALIDSSGRFRDGVLQGTRCFTRDVTEQRRAERELEAALRQLATTEKLAALGSLVSGVAHEVRTPLTIVQTNLHALEVRAARAQESGDYAPLAAALPEVVSDVDAAIERVQALVRSLRRVVAPSGAARPQPLGPVVQEAMRLFSAVNRDRAALQADLEPTPDVRVDATKIEQVVLNLLDNAAQATASANGAIRVRTRTLGHEGRVALIVEDDGVGMSPDVLARIYDPLFTTRGDGMGLGLHIVHRIVEEHGGSIACESAPGRGCRFTITFPIAAPARAGA